MAAKTIMDIYILVGQSNMAGRGSLSSFNNDQVPLGNNVFRFSAANEWESAYEPMHKDIDLRKASSCGIGPAFSFAQQLLIDAGSIESVGDANNTPLLEKKFGFIPCAIGGSALAEWMPDAPSPPADQNYAPYSSNFFDATISRTKQALEKENGSRLAGIIWYQGETDALDDGLADSYRERLKIVFQAFRSYLDVSSLPIVMVAITAVPSKRSIPALFKLRSTQLTFSQDVGSVEVVDSFGLLLQKDGLHLTSSHGQFKLGREIYKAFLRIKQRNITCSGCASGGGGNDGDDNDGHEEEHEEEMGYTKTGTANTWWGGNEWGWVDPSAKQVTSQHLKPCFDQVASMDYDDLIQMSELAEQESDQLNTQAEESSLLKNDQVKETIATASGTVVSTAPNGVVNKNENDKSSLNETAKFPLFSQRFSRRPCNFVYGEINPSSVANLLSIVNPMPGEVIVDLGSGAGKVVLLSALLYPKLGKVIGIEMMQGYLRDARVAHKLLKDSLKHEKSHQHFDQQEAMENGKCSEQEQSLLAPVQWVQGDFLNEEVFAMTWKHADVVFACSTCFDEATMSSISQLAALLKPSARFVTLDKPLSQVRDTDTPPPITEMAPVPPAAPDTTSSCVTSNSTKEAVHPTFSNEVGGYCQVRGSWGFAVAHIHTSTG